MSRPDGSGKTMWFAALGLLHLGGGGQKSLAVAWEDFPQNDALKALDLAPWGNQRP